MLTAVYCPSVGVEHCCFQCTAWPDQKPPKPCCRQSNLAALLDKTLHAQDPVLQSVLGEAFDQLGPWTGANSLSNVASLTDSSAFSYLQMVPPERDPKMQQSASHPQPGTRVEQPSAPPPPGGVDVRLNWSLRPGQQVSECLQNLATEAGAAEQRSQRAKMRTWARLAALLESGGLRENSLGTLQSIGRSLLPPVAAASNIQLVVGSPLGTGLETLQNGSNQSCSQLQAQSPCSMHQQHHHASSNKAKGQTCWSPACHMHFPARHAAAGAHLPSTWLAQWPCRAQFIPESIICCIPTSSVNTVAHAAATAQDSLHHKRLAHLLS